MISVQVSVLLLISEANALSLLFFQISTCISAIKELKQHMCPCFPGNTEAYQFCFCLEILGANLHIIKAENRSGIVSFASPS